MNKIEFTDQEFLDVMNCIIAADTAVGETFVKLTSMDQSLGEDQLDSLGTVVFFAWIDHIFKIPTEKVQEFSQAKTFTMKAIKDFIVNNTTRTYTYEEVVDFIKTCS